MNFLRENWAWIVVPIVLFVAVAIAVVVFSSTPMDQHRYPTR